MDGSLGAHKVDHHGGEARMDAGVSEEAISQFLSVRFRVQSTAIVAMRVLRCLYHRPSRRVERYQCVS